MNGITVYQDEISLAMELYHNGERIPVRVCSVGEADETGTGELEITIHTVKGFPAIFTNKRPSTLTTGGKE